MRLKHWTEYKHYRNKTRNLIRNAKRQHFTKSIENVKDTSTLWKHLRAVLCFGTVFSNKGITINCYEAIWMVRP